MSIFDSIAHSFTTLALEVFQPTMIQSVTLIAQALKLQQQFL